MTRNKAIEILNGGSIMERLQLYFAELELIDLGETDSLLLTRDELAQLEDLTRDGDNELFERTLTAYSNLLNLSMRSNYYIEVLKKYKNNCFVVFSNIAMAEALETAVNIALDNIEDGEKREAVADGIARNATLFGCVVDTHLGYIRVNTEAKNIPDNLERMRKEALQMYTDSLVTYKSLFKALYDFINHMDIKLEAVKNGLIKDYDMLEEVLEKPLVKFTSKTQNAITSFPPAPAGVKPMLAPYATMADWNETKADKKKVAEFTEVLMQGLDN